MKTDTVILSSNAEHGLLNVLSRPCAEVVKIENYSFTLMPFSQKEADTKIVLHAKVLLKDTNDNITIRSRSEDTDIFIIVISFL